MSLLVDIEKRKGRFQLDVHFEVGNETLALLGASGSGKSMTLKCIAGVEKPDRGRIVLNGVTLYDSERKVNRSVQERKTGLIFQNYALFPNMTVRQNVAAGARRERNPEKRKELVRELMERFDLVSKADQYPDELSGGEQQRTALARVLVSAPDILLLDEPFSALDAHLRLRLEQEVRQVIRTFGKTVLLVSHDRGEVYRMADQIAILQSGRIEQVGTKETVFTSPATKSSAVLTGCGNISRLQKLDERHVLALDWGLKLCVWHVPEDAKYVGIRMNEIRSGGGSNSFWCRVEEVVENPFSDTLFLRAAEGGGTFGWETERQWREQYPGSRGSMVQIQIPPDAILLLKS